MTDSYLLSLDNGTTWHAITFKALGERLRYPGTTFDRLWNGEMVETKIGLVKCVLAPKHSEETNP